MEIESNESIISSIDINLNIKEEKEFISFINYLNSLIVNYFQISLGDNEEIDELTKSFEDELCLLESIPENVSNIIMKYNSKIKKIINSIDFNLREFFWKVKNLFELIKEKKQNYSKNANSNYQINSDDNKLQNLSKENKKLKENNRKLEKKCGQLTSKIIELELENYQIKKDNDLTHLKKKNEELNEDIKKIKSEKEKLEEILDEKGINIIGGVEIEVPKDEILKKYENKIRKLEKENKILKEFKDFEKKHQNSIESDICGDNNDLKSILSINDEEMNSLKKNEILLKDVDDLKDKLSKEKEDNNISKDIDSLNIKYKELKRDYPKNKIINSINNININNEISIDGIINKLISLTKENEKLKNELNFISELNIKSIKRSCFEIGPESEEEYNNEMMSDHSKKLDNYQNLAVDSPNIFHLVEKGKELDFTLNIMIKKIKDLLITEKNDKNLRIELSKILELNNN